MKKAFGRTPLSEQGWDFAEVAQYVYASMQRGARELLEQDGTLTPRKRRGNGLQWVFWAEEPKRTSKRGMTRKNNSD